MSEPVVPALCLASIISIAGCLSAPPATTAKDDAGTMTTEDGGVADDADARLPPAVLGNVLMLSFDRMDSGRLVWDRSGHSRHGRHTAKVESDCPYGECLLMAAADDVMFAPDPGLGRGAPLTIEAWVKPTSFPHEAGAVFSNLGSSLTPVGDYSFELLSAGGMRFITNDGGERVDRAATSAAIPLDTWTHVAVSWDGSTVRFYQDGVTVGEEPLDAVPTPVDDLRKFFAGRRTGGGMRFVGAMDEIKVSDWAKSREDIRQSMNFDSAFLLDRCGDRIAEDGELCDGQDLCCEPESCTPLADDSVCSAAAGTCADSVCAIDDAERVTRGLVALYDFAAAADGVLEDVSGVDIALDLELATGEVTQNDGYIAVTMPARFRSPVAAAKIAAACTESHELSIEAWLRPADDTQGGPARVVTMSNGIELRNFTLAQEGDRWVARVSSSGSDPNGIPDTHTASGDVAASGLQHVVLTVDDSERRLYVDGRLRARGAVPGRFDGWDSNFPLLIGNEQESADPGDERPWLGEMHLVAVYCAALTEAEIATNYGAGANPVIREGAP